MSSLPFIVLIALALAGCTAQPAPITPPTLSPRATLVAAPTPEPATVTRTATPVPGVAATVAVASATSTAAADDGLTPEQRQVLTSLPSLGPAPELRNEVWLNSEPLRLADLRGRVVLLDMWTYG